MSVTLVPEDGTAMTTSNTFVSEDAFQAYCDNHGFDYSSYSDDQQSAALVLAGDYLNNEDRFWWRGTRVADEQAMAWPRQNVVVLFGTGNALASNIIPQKVKDAQCYLAWKQLSSGVDIQPDQDRGGKIASVNAGGVSVSFQPNALSEVLYATAMGILHPYLRKTYYVITPTIVSDDRGYTKVSEPTTPDGIEDRPGSDDTISAVTDPITGSV